MKRADPARHDESIDWSLTTWEGSRREQLRRWAELPLERAILALEEMEALFRNLEAEPSSMTEVREPPVTYGRDAAPFDLSLAGCRPEPLMSYLKALGVLRLVSEQRDANARCWWENDVFWLRSALDRDALLSFFFEEYKPTPIIAPWAGGSGFFRKDNKKAVDALSKSTSPRARAYSRIIRIVRAIIKDERVGDKPRDNDKVRLIRRYRNELPDEVVAWMDAVMTVQQTGQGFAPLLGTGGNDGRLDFTQNFMQRIVSLGLHKGDPVGDKSRTWLEQTLFAIPATLNKGSVGQFAPGRAGGPNATQGMEGDSTDNPWDFVLMLEGTLLFAGAAVRRFGVADASRAAFPFTVRAIGAGVESTAPKDGVESRGELWLPLWTRPTSTSGLRQLLGEGRAEVSGRRARDGTDFARAVAALGVDNGIVAFNRIALLKRSGKAFLAAPLGRFEVVERSGADLLREVDPWLRRLRRECSTKDAPPRFVSALHRFDSAVFKFCKYGGAPLFQGIVIALGGAERVLATAESFRDNKKLRPLGGLSPSWIEAADDKSAEFDLALALASVHDPEAKTSPLRANLEPVDWKKKCREWAEGDRGVAWNAADLATNLATVLQRRLMDAARVGCERLPLASHSKVSLDVVASFLAGDLDDQRIEDLIWALMLTRSVGAADHIRVGVDEAPVPRAYALLKLLFLPQPLVIQRGTDGLPFARLPRDNEEDGVVIRPEPSILSLLRGHRLGEACAIGMHRLRASGLDPMPRPIRGRGVRDDDWRELDRVGGTGIDPLRLAAALLIPIDDDAVSRLVRLVIGGDEMESLRAVPATGMNFVGGALP